MDVRGLPLDDCDDNFKIKIILLRMNCLSGCNIYDVRISRKKSGRYTLDTRSREGKEQEKDRKMKK